jgi:hypothetical protein
VQKKKKKEDYFSLLTVWSCELCPFHCNKQKKKEELIQRNTLWPLRNVIQGLIAFCGSLYVWCHSNSRSNSLRINKQVQLKHLLFLLMPLLLPLLGRDRPSRKISTTTKGRRNEETMKQSLLSCVSSDRNSCCHGKKLDGDDVD